MIRAGCDTRALGCLWIYANALAHIKSLDFFEVSDAGVNPLTQPPKVTIGLESRRVLADVSGLPPPVGWIERLQCLAVARRACAAARGRRDSSCAPEVAALMGVSVRALYSWIAEHRLPPDTVFRAGRPIVIRRRALESWLAGKQDGKGPPAQG
jgi:excisionase family DNA binding protein